LIFYTTLCSPIKILKYQLKVYSRLLIAKLFISLSRYLLCCSCFST